MICKKCFVDKDTTEFYKSKLTISGLRGACKVCTREEDKQYRMNNVEKVQYSSKRKRVWRDYRITPEQYDKAMESKVCAICGKEGKQNACDMLCYDHDHNTHKFRGVLCRACNQSIGHLGDTAEALYKAYLYLKKSEDN